MMGVCSRPTARMWTRPRQTLHHPSRPSPGSRFARERPCPYLALLTGMPSTEYQSQAAMHRGGAQAGPAVPQRLVKRTDSAIQRAYDAAPGPPSKSDAQAMGPPSAPPAVPSVLPPTHSSSSVSTGAFGVMCGASDITRTARHASPQHQSCQAVVNTGLRWSMQVVHPRQAARVRQRQSVQSRPMSWMSCRSASRR